MKNANSKRLLTLVLALVLVFALSVGAYASWVSFQNDETNNGRISTAPPTGTSPTVTPVQLSTNGYAYSGVDVTPVIDENGNAYTLYNGGAPGTGNVGGARLSSVALSSGNSNWDIQLDADANNDQQISTPYYAGNNTLYAGVTYYTDALASTPMSSWNSGAISGGVLTIPANSSVTLTLTAALLNGTYSQAYFDTGILSAANGDLSGSATMYAWANQTLYAYGTSSSWAGSNFCVYNQNGMLLPSDTYDISITLTNNTNAAVTTSHISLMVSGWRLYKVTGTNTASPTVTLVNNGLGQISTPITAGGSYLYFGIYEGDRSYYQFDPSDNSKIKFSSYTGAGYYWAGAAVVGDYVYFGDENGIVYQRPIGPTFGSATGVKYYLYSQVTSCGPVRSSICYDGSDLYLTSYNGYLWQLNTALSTATAIDIKETDYVLNSSSTPVVSTNGYIYVGGFQIDYTTYSYSGAIKTVPVSNFDPSALATVWTNDSEAVQSSLIVYSTSRPKTDYLYFTTNGGAGCGRCISYATASGTKTDLWETPAQTSRTYTLQGMASDGGYVVFGNDLNYLYIAH